MKNKTRKDSVEQIIAQLEKEGKFDVDYLPQAESYIMPDKDFCFVKKNIFYKISCKVIRTITFLFGPIVTAFSCCLKVKGKKNLIGIKGAICVCNHVSILDTLYVKQAVGHYRSYHTGAPWNNRKGLGGAIMRRAGFLSLGGSFSARKNFNACVESLLKKGAIINFYPEEALWQQYKKPRPLKSGAFKLAALYNVPIIPLFVTYVGKHNRAIINILPPLYCDQTLTVQQNVENLRNDCQKAWTDLYQNTYGKQLVYTTENSISNT